VSDHILEESKFIFESFLLSQLFLATLAV